MEFLFRDAKNYTGLENCQARSVIKINFHVNASLTTVSLAKAIHYFPIPKDQGENFSMLDVQKLFKIHLEIRLTINRIMDNWINAIPDSGYLS
ncbi:MAG: hypothetical protein M0Q38_01855 [Bacteroidales bacterium]|nr:hypothetical protein [Bacteroidales bacterium]